MMRRYDRKVIEVWTRMRALTEGQVQKSWYSIRHEADQAEVRIYDEIGGWGVSAKQFADELRGVTAARLTVALNTPGGEVFDGLAIYNALKDFKGRVTTRVDGLAASIGSLIAMAGAEIVMQPGSLMMLHKPWALAIGNATDMRAMADTLDKVEGSLVGIYAARSGKSEHDIKAILAADTWLNAQEAVYEGFATSAPEPVSPPPADQLADQAPTHSIRSQRQRRLRLAEAL